MVKRFQFIDLFIETSVSKRARLLKKKKKTKKEGTNLIICNFDSPLRLSASFFTAEQKQKHTAILSSAFVQSAEP